MGAIRGSVWGRLSLRTKGLLVIAIPLVPLLVAMVMLVVQTRLDQERDRQITDARQSRDATAAVLAIAVDAETGVRGYVATGNPVFLEPFTDAVADLEAIEDLVELAGVPVTALDLLEDQYGVLQELATDGDSMPPARREALLLRGKANMDELRSVLEARIGSQDDALNTALEEREGLHRLTALILWVGGTTGVLGALLGISLFVRDIAGRVKLLQENSRRIDGSAPLEPIRGGDEVGALGIALEETRRSLIEKDALRKQAEAEMIRSRDEADRANRAKSEFLSRMSHELRTPLNAILGFAQLLEMDQLKEDQLESVAHIRKGGRHLLDLINEVLDIARIESGKLSLSLEPVDLIAVIEESMAMMEPLAAEKDIRLDRTFEVSSTDRYVKADRQRLKQIILNLVSNGIKYNRPGGSVTVTGRDFGDRFGFEVLDTGLGFSEKDLESLFTPFDRLGAENSDVEGTGLGLALSKRLAEAMGGDIEVVSELGRGSTFLMGLPKAEDPVPVQGAASAAEGAAPSPSADVTLLYIEDNLSNLQLVERILHHRPQVELLSAMQGRLGIDLARKHAPDLILLDVNLPDIPGGEVLRTLKSDPRTARIPVVMLSADATSGQIERNKAAGADDYLTKPLDVAGFLHLIDRVAIEATA